MKTDTFHVVTVISNPIRFKSRYALYNNFKKQVSCAGATLWTVEIAFGDRPFEVTEASNPFHLQLRSFEELWHKENMLNLVIQRLPLDWEYVAWIDADISFNRPDWVVETVHQLQHYQVIQMFSKAVDLDPHYNIMKSHNGFMWSFFQNGHKAPKGYGYRKYGLWHPGFAWAARKEAIDQLGGLIDFGILGAGDRHMATALIGSVEDSVPDNIGKFYMNELRVWQGRAAELRKDVGYMDGTISHFWHGKKKDRRYTERWKILIDNDFDPDFDIKRDWQGLFQLAGNKPMLRDQIRAYFRARNEDSIDLC